MEAAKGKLQNGERGVEVQLLQLHSFKEKTSGEIIIEPHITCTLDLVDIYCISCLNITMYLNSLKFWPCTMTVISFCRSGVPQPCWAYGHCWSFKRKVAGTTTKLVLQEPRSVAKWLSWRWSQSKNTGRFPTEHSLRIEGGASKWVVPTDTKYLALLNLLLLWKSERKPNLALCFGEKKYWGCLH